MSNQDEEPKDLGIRMSTKRGAELDRIIRIQKETIIKSSVNLDIDKIILEYCEKAFLKESKIFEDMKK